MDARKALLALLALTVFAGVVSAETTMPNINWSVFAEYMAGVAVVIGGIVVVIVAVFPIMILMAIVRFMTGLLTKILKGIEIHM